MRKEQSFRFALVMLFLLRRTHWDKVPPYPVVRRRRAGTLARAAWNLYRHHVPAFVVVGLLAVPVGLLAVLNVVVLQHLPLPRRPSRRGNGIDPRRWRAGSYGSSSTSAS